MLSQLVFVVNNKKNIVQSWTLFLWRQGILKFCSYFSALILNNNIRLQPWRPATKGSLQVATGGDQSGRIIKPRPRSVEPSASLHHHYHHNLHLLIKRSSSSSYKQKVGQCIFIIDIITINRLRPRRSLLLHPCSHPKSSSHMMPLP